LATSSTILLAVLKVKVSLKNDLDGKQNQKQILLILGFRFLYGLRTVTPFVIGASKITPTRFIILNILGAAIWAVIVGGMGYLFGYTLEIFIDNVKKYELLVFAGLTGVGIIIWLLRFTKKPSVHKSMKPTSKDDPADE